MKALLVAAIALSVLALGTSATALIISVKRGENKSALETCIEDLLRRSDAATYFQGYAYCTQGG